MIFEHRTHPLAPVSVFLRRFAVWFGFACGMIAATLLLGIGGYHWIAGLGWIDSLLNASMILGGMGPVDKLSTPGAKVFASLYALFCGLIFVGAVGLVLSPILHRLLHKFHIDDVDLQSEQLPSETDGSAAK